MLRPRTPACSAIMAIAATFSLLAVMAVPALMPPASHAADFSAGAQMGYIGGGGALVQGEVASFASNFPLSLRLSASLASREPGVATDARRIFINDATNGTPTESGRLSAFSMDLIYPLKATERSGFYVFAGPRYSSFTGNFQFIGGNEDFDITSSGWGAGLGLEGRFQMGMATQFVIGGGGDYYPSYTLTGHDTSYSPDGETINGRDDYTYDNADDAVNQPKWAWRLTLGVNYLFGR